MRTSCKVTTYGIFYLVTLEPLDRVRIFIVASIKTVFDYVDLEYKSAQHIKSPGGVKKNLFVYRCILAEFFELRRLGAL